MFYSGFELAYVSGEFPLLLPDSESIALVMCAFGVSEVFGGIVLGKVSDLVGRKIMVTFAFLSYSAALPLSWWIQFNGGKIYLCYIAAVCMGLGKYFHFFLFFKN